MKQMSFILLLFAILFISCTDDNDVVEPFIVELDCEQIDCPVTEEFYGIGLMNDECWMSAYAVLDPFTPLALSVIIGKGETNGIAESLSFSINKQTDLSDTIWLGWTDYTNPIPNIAFAHYSYSEDHSSAGGFRFSSNSALTYEDFLLIDYMNEDTSIVEGRFQLRFSEKSVSNFVTHAPDTMRFECGSFRAREP